jgi:predicted TPR repeat methyltransferase
MKEHNNHLSRAFDLDNPEDIQNFYSDWAKTYDAEILENGYVTPQRCAAALAEFAPSKDLSLLDVGCGTGLSGKCLAEVGFTRIDGCDLNHDMLEVAKTRGIYNRLWQTTTEDPLQFQDGLYDAISAIGVIGSGAAPVTLLYELFKKIGQGGLIVFSFNDHTLKDPAFECCVMNHTDCGAFELLFKEHGPHLPKKGIGANVYVMRKR